ncbi:MAG: hypothetical protein GXO79_02070 [Chlorobi bacterium]|nr:hypothetical protein [Chlorobiota bacterium]
MKKDTIIIKNVIYFLTLLLSLFTFSCIKLDKEPQRPISNSELWNCYNKTEWNENRIRESIIGKWKWIYTYDYWQPDDARYTDNENIVIEFFNDSTLNVINNNKFEFSNRWSIRYANEDFYELKLDTSISFLWGRILICDDIIEFYASYEDLSDNYFKKID